MQTSRNKAFLEAMQTLADSIKQQVYVLSGPIIDGKYQYNDESLMIVLSSKKMLLLQSKRLMTILKICVKIL